MRAKYGAMQYRITFSSGFKSLDKEDSVVDGPQLIWALQDPIHGNDI